MLLDEVFKIIDRLTPEQKQEVKQYIDHQPDILQHKINTILASAQPTPLKAGTMDMDRLLHAVHAMWDGLDEPEIEAIVQAMNEEYIEPDTDITADE
jgi:hydroxymethylpyrimidine/phosphomethylpyrimidine kinase